MKGKKWVSALLAAAIAGSALVLPASAADTAGQAPVLRPKQVSSMPVIDGQLKDSVWSLENSMGEAIPASPAHSAKFGVLWDYTYLYIGVDVKKDTGLVAGNAWLAGDTFSFLVDKTMHKSGPYTDSDWQVGIGYNPDDDFNPTVLFGAGMANTEEARAKLARGMLAATHQTDTGWSAEVAVPWEDLGIDPYTQKKFGFDAAVDSKAPDAAQAGSIFWSLNGQSSVWDTTAGFGTVELSDTVVENTDGDVILSENFDGTADGALPAGFVPAAGQAAGWSVQDGRLSGSFNDGGKVEQRMVLPALGGNFTYDVDVSFQDATDTGRWLSAFYRAPRDGGFGYYHFTNRLNGAAEISMKGTDDTWPTAFVDTRNDAPAPLQKDKTYHLSMSAFGQYLSHKRTGAEEAEGFDRSVEAYDKLGESRPATMLSDLQQGGRFGLQVDRAQASFDNLVIRKLYATQLRVEGVPASVRQFEDLPALKLTATLNDGSTVPVDVRDAKLYSSDSGILKILDGGAVRALRKGTCRLSVRVGNVIVDKTVTVAPGDHEALVTKLSLRGDAFRQMTVGGSAALSDFQFDFENEALETGTVGGDGKGMSFTSSDPAVVAVENGSLKVLKKGAATITAQIDGASDTFTVWARQDENDHTWIDEDFEGGAVPDGWSKTGTGGDFRVEEDGNGGKALVLDRGTRVRIPMPQGVDDYTIEADLTFLTADDDARWASIMYRIQNEDSPYYQFAVRRNAAAANGVEFAAQNNGWDVRATGSYSQALAYGKPYRLQVTITGNKVKEWINGEEMIFTDKAADLTGGDIGLQCNNGTVRFDNLKVSLNPEELPEVPKPENNYVDAKNLNENLVLAPVVIADGLQSLDDAQALIDDGATTSVLLQAKLEKGALQVYHGGKKLGSLPDVLEKLYTRLLLLLEVEDQESADALAAYINENKVEDLQAVSRDPALLQKFRNSAKNTRGVLICEDGDLTVDEAHALVEKANTARSMSVLLTQSAASDKAAVEELQRHMLCVWAQTDGTPVGVYGAINAGVNGLLASDPARIAALSKVYTGRTLTRRSFVVGHRGTPSNAPENTMAGFRKVYEEYGAQMFENDVYLTKDKRVIVLHDSTFARTTDILTNTKIPDSVFTNGVTRQNCRPQDLTLEQIKLLDAGSYYGEAYKGEQIPTLDEMLAYMKGRDIELFLELKDYSDGIEKATTDLIEQYGVAGQVSFITFNAKSVPIAQQQAPGISFGYLNSPSLDASNPMAAVREASNLYVPMNCASDAVYNNAHNEVFLRNMLARGTSVWTWTYSTGGETAFAQAIDLGITGLTTNNANWAKDYVFSLAPQRDSYTLDSGKSLTLQAVGTTNAGAQKTYAPEVIVIDGQDVLSASGSTVTAKKAGTASVMLRAKTQMGGASYDLYTKPVTVQVKGQAPYADLKGEQRVYPGGTRTFTIHSDKAPESVVQGNGAVASVNAPSKPWDPVTKTSVWSVYAVSSSARRTDSTNIYCTVDGQTTALFSVKIDMDRPFTCDTTQDITLRPGGRYCAKVTVPHGTRLDYNAGNGKVAVTWAKNGGRPQVSADGKTDTYYYGLTAGETGAAGLYLHLNGETFCVYHVNVR